MCTRLVCVPQDETKETSSTSSKSRETKNNGEPLSSRKKECRKQKKRNNNEKNSKLKKLKKENEDKDSPESKDDDSGDDKVFPSIGGPCPEFGLPYWSYDLDTEIKDLLSGNTFKIRDVVEGRVDTDGFPIKKAADAKK